MEAVKEYIAVYPYKNEVDSNVELAVNDVVEVAALPDGNQGPDVPGWIRGKNRRTGVDAFYPGSYLTPLDKKTDLGCPRNKMAGSPAKNTMLHKFEDYNDSGYGGSPLPAAPSLPPRRSTVNPQIQLHKTHFLAELPGKHRFSDVYFLAPILCTHCHDYIWGSGKVGVKCEECQGVYHQSCAKFVASGDASACPGYHDQPVADVQPPHTVPQDVAISQWTAAHVVEWMAALNLYRYAELFRSKDIKGVDLLSLDKDKLANMGVKDEFHQRAILVCVDELCQRSATKEPSPSGACEAGGPEHGSPSPPPPTQPQHQHRLAEASFQTLERCDKCHKFLRGLLHQGLLCHSCGLIAHRTCSATGLPACLPGQADRSGRLVDRTVFGVGLCQLSGGAGGAPGAVLRLVQEIEARASAAPGLDLYRLYRTTSPPAEAIARLRAQLGSVETDPGACDLSSFEAHVLASGLKKLLRELPDPLIPSQWYDAFVEASRGTRDDQCAAQLYRLVGQLPEPHRATLRCLLAHVCRLCQWQHARGRNEPPTLVVQVFAHIILRPPWERIIQVVHNAEAHVRVLELLLLRCDWGEKMPEFAPAPSLPPRTHRPSSQPTGDGPGAGAGEPESSLAEADWYWANITREEVNDLMKDTPDGTFLVRDASSKAGEYTLTLRKGGSNKLIKICCSRQGRYGFSEPYRFASVPELIHFYRSVSLAQYNPTLDVKLLYPVSRFKHAEEVEVGNGDVDKIKQRLESVKREYLNRSRLYDQYYEEYSRCSQEIQLKKQALNAFDEAILMFEEQIRLHEKFQREAHRHEIHGLVENYELLRARMAALQQSHKELQENLQYQVAYSRTLDREMNALKPELHQLCKTRDILQMYVNRHEKSCPAGTPTSVDEAPSVAPAAPARPPEPQRGGFDNKGFQGDMPREIYADSKYWLLPDCSRAEAERYLASKADGTFLVRRSTNGGGPFALSIKCKGAVGHALIYLSERGYGFAEPYLVHPQLSDLVLHYANHSLEEHNAQLTTRLAYPLHGPQPDSNHYVL